MSTVMVKYTVKPEHVERNKELVRNVYASLQDSQPAQDPSGPDGPGSLARPIKRSNQPVELILRQRLYFGAASIYDFWR
jgi:hypothetical protein